MPRILDLFCGAGGSSRGYADAGFDVVGVDSEPQPNYPHTFQQADALEVLSDRAFLETFDAIHAGPVCKGYSTVGATARRHHGAEHPDQIPAVRTALWGLRKPYVIENVIGAPLLQAVQLCGSSFGLDLRRHRLFESNVQLVVPPCKHDWQTPRFRSLDSRMVRRGQLASVIGVHGNTQYAGEFALRCKAMGIDWMTNAELSQAIPPVYTEYIGAQLLDVIQGAELVTLVTSPKPGSSK
jgi:DNA (cytosine-5)-methyltransferase 1